MAGDADPGISTGGMITKLDAAKLALSGGCAMAIAKGDMPHALKHLADGARATWFVASDQPVTARKRWISGTLKPMGDIVIDAGACAALARGKSLLPAGVRAVNGHFQRGDAVRILGPDGQSVGKGLSAYPSSEAEKIAGKQTGEVRDILGYDGRGELIHRDDMVLEARQLDIAAEGDQRLASSK